MNTAHVNGRELNCVSERRVGQIHLGNWRADVRGATCPLQVGLTSATHKDHLGGAPVPERNDALSA